MVENVKYANPMNDME